MSDTDPKGPGGRPLDNFIVNNFEKTRPEHEDGKTYRWYMKCRHCSTEILHRDSRCLNHLAHGNECKSASPEVRGQALKKLSDKVQHDTKPGKSAQSVLWADDGLKGAVKKRKIADSSIASFADRPLEPERQGKLDRKLVR
jgi:hypothetical protein